MLRRFIAAAIVIAQCATYSGVAQAKASKKTPPKPAPKSSTKTAPASEPGIEDEQTKIAKQYFKAAETDFSLGRFDAALTNYSKAYESKALPAFLYNIGQCHMELAHYERAIFFYEQYLRGDVSPARRTLVNKRLEEARVRQREQEAEADKAAAEQRDREQQELALRAQEQATLAAMQAEAERVNLMSAPPEKPIYKKPLFWVAVGAVAVGATAAILIATRKTNHELPHGDLDTIDARQ